MLAWCVFAWCVVTLVLVSWRDGVMDLVLVVRVMVMVMVWCCGIFVTWLQRHVETHNHTRPHTTTTARMVPPCRASR